MYGYYRRLFILHIATNLIALILTISLFLTFVPFVLFLALLFLALSTLIHSLLLYVQFFREASLYQLFRGILLVFIVILVFFQLILKAI